MNVAWFTLLTVALPLFLIWLVVKIAPDFVGKLLFKPIEYASDARLAKLRDNLNRESTLTIEDAKAELQAVYSTLKTSADVLLAGQSGMRTEIIAAVKVLWAEIILLRTTYGAVVTFYEVFTADEISAALAGTAHSQILHWVQIAKSTEDLGKKALEASRKDLDEARLFCGDRLWLLFYTTRSVYLRLAWLTNNAVKFGKRVDWRSDHGIPGFLAAVLSKEEMEQVREQHQGLSMGINRIEALFLHEAALLMSGSKAMSESLSDMQAIMQFQQQRARKDMLQKEEA